MVLQLQLPPALEQKLRSEVQAGRYASLEEAVLDRLSREDADWSPEDFGLSIDELRADLEQAWTEREGFVDGAAAFDRLAARSNGEQSSGQ